MQTIALGLGSKHDKGSDPSIAINQYGAILEVHKNELGHTLYHRVGTVRGATVDWGPSLPFPGSGHSPGCALNTHGNAVAVHQEDGKVRSRVGTVANGAVTWAEKSYVYDDGDEPDVALNDSGTVVEVHEATQLSYRVGRLVGDRVHWEMAHGYSEGKRPRVAINNNGLVVVVHPDGRNLNYLVGTLIEDRIDFGGVPPTRFATGDTADVAMLDDGQVFVVTTNAKKLSQRGGRVEGRTIVWNGDEVPYDDGRSATLAAAGVLAVEEHVNADTYGFLFCTSLITDRASWMLDRLYRLGKVPLRGLVLPGSHDAAMYRPGFIESWARTQDLSIFDQLACGIRYFDLRPKWNGEHLVIHHGGAEGPSLAEVLGDVRRFAADPQRHELVLLVLSHFSEIDDDVYENQLIPACEGALGQWMIKEVPAGKARLADVTLAEYVANGVAVMVVIDDEHGKRLRKKGFWYFTKPEWEDAAEGDLRVYDRYSETNNAGKMKENQYDKFKKYDGMCHPEHKPEVPCDLFLLSWCLTVQLPLPPYTVAVLAREINPGLGGWMADLPVPNGYGQIVGVVFSDYVEWGRLTDVVLYQNGELKPAG